VAIVSAGPATPADLVASAKMDGNYFVEITTSNTCPPTEATKPYKIHVTDAIGTATDITVSVVARDADKLITSPAEIDSTKKGRTPVIIKGGKAEYKASAKGDGIQVKPTVDKEGKFEVIVDKEKASGSVDFTDSSDPPLKVNVPIKPKNTN
jgi:hypothetical protein